ncbi:MAG TPA: aspartate aminotransferase family protein [Symbiobacteriaceae bacterium]|jgi:acetylornithine/succinyldiaminopimelate/putrescine aminotransferase
MDAEATNSKAIKTQALHDFAEYVNPMKARILAHAGLDIIEGRREGARVWDVTGRSYIDCITSAGSFNAGRRNPHIIAALKAALDELDQGIFLICSKAKADLAKRLAEITPGDIKYSMFGASGGEVVDFAIKLARGYTRRPRIISTLKGYHGHTGFALSAIGRDAYQDPFRPLMPGFDRIPFGDAEALASAIGEDTAAFIIEPIQGEGGIQVPPPGYLRAVREICDRAGALLILDEIQTGFGRTGKLFACEHEGVVPDIMTLGKSLGGGLYPITAAVFREPLGDFLVANPYIHLSTFGGADLGCAVGLATIDEIIGQDLPGHATAMGERFMAGFRQLQAKYPEVLAEVRGRGLMIGLQYLDQSMGPRMSYQLAQRGVIALYTGNDPSVMRLQPSLVISPAEVDEVLAAVDGAMAAIVAGVADEPAARGKETRRRRPRETEEV